LPKKKAKDMNTQDIEAVKKMVAGTARSMGVELEQ
jgi:ribosomal protein L11